MVSTPLAAAVAAVALAFVGSDALAHNPGWKSGTRGGDMAAFASWRGTPLGVAVGWAPWNNWSDMLGYISSSNPRALRSKSPNVSIALGLFPQGGSLSACAAGQYNANHRSIGSRLAANGVGDAELRLAWEASNRSYPWTAVDRPADQWKKCFCNATRAFKSGSASLRVSWHMAKKGKIDVRTIWPDECAVIIANVSLSHYDDAWARFGNETINGGPWGLRAWLAFAKVRGKKLSIGEWGVGRDGDRPEYIQQMHDFFHEAGAALAHEGYFNAANKQLYPKTNLPKSAARYRELF